MGVFLALSDRVSDSTRLPHARGGVSYIQRAINETTLSSPRPWGCFFTNQTRSAIAVVFPTPVGVFPAWGLQLALRDRLPHARGGVSLAYGSSLLKERSSPRPWGCFQNLVKQNEAYAVFPTPVGVFLVKLTCDRQIQCLPHARGGVSITAEIVIL